MDAQYFSFPQRPPDEVVPAISKLYSSVHRRLASIVSGSPSNVALSDSTLNDRTPPVSPQINNARDSASKLGPFDLLSSIEANESTEVQSSRGSPHTRVADAEAFTFPTRKPHVELDADSQHSSVPRTSSSLFLNAARKAAPFVQTEPLTAAGDLDYLDTPTSSPFRGHRNTRTNDVASNSVPGFTLEREISSESETPSSPGQQRRPSLAREESISTVLTRLKSGTLSKEFWMKDQNAYACFRCEGNFTSECPMVFA